MNINENALNSLKSLLSNIILYLSDMGAVELSRTDKGIIVKETDKSGGYIYINYKYLDIEKLDKLNLKTENAFFKQITPIDELFESLETLLSHYPSDKYIKYGITLEDIKNNIKKTKNPVKNNVKIPTIKGTVYQIVKTNERYILAKDYPINTRITYEEPMVNNLSNIWEAINFTVTL